jgi:hypothetical protein
MITAYLFGGLAVVSILLTVLPSGWVGTPYLSLANTLNPGIDAPDNWAIAFTYFIRIVVGLTVAATAAAIVAICCSKNTVAVFGNQE